MKCTIQLGFASLYGTFHLSPHENIYTIALINIHYLYNIISKQALILKDMTTDLTRYTTVTFKGLWEFYILRTAEMTFNGFMHILFTFMCIIHETINR